MSVTRGGDGDGSCGEVVQVTLLRAVVERYRRFSVYNSPYPAHDRGHGIDLYPETNVAAAPVAGEVLDTRTVQCPDRSYAVDHDHLILIDTGDVVARVLHVDPAVAAGDHVAVGDPLGGMVRSGFFGQWVDNHVHVEFRDPTANLYRASGSLPLAVDVPVAPVTWNGTARVVDTGETYAVLDAPSHPDPGTYVSLASDEGVPLDGGLPHYTGGGRLDRTPTASDEASLSLFGTPVGTATGRTVTWDDVAVSVDGKRVTGLSLFASREAGFGPKVVSRPAAGEPSFEIGETVSVSVERVDDPRRLG
ncbi:hypothetical protein RYH80_13045 [Halobaculum sp. MBLA0147]|uniref:hypothetical protein n=1 Tax=Halobaculum sp. MBLA0147 TaxID=3079934 RepID=UPI003525B4C9